MTAQVIDMETWESPIRRRDLPSGVTVTESLKATRFSDGIRMVHYVTMECDLPLIPSDRRGIPEHRPVPFSYR